MSTETMETGMIKVEEITSIMMGAGEVLAKNKKLSDSAVNKAKALQDTIEGEGMSDLLDTELNDWMVKAKQADTIMKNRRTPITQMANQVVKAFTFLESPLDSTKKDSYYATFQNYRNGWAKKRAEEQREKEQQILRNQNIAKEKIVLKANIENIVRSTYTDKLFEFKKYYQDLVNNMTIENVEETRTKIKDIKMLYPRDRFYEIAAPVTSAYMDKVQLASFIFETRAALYDELAANFRENMESLQFELLEMFPAKIIELKEIAKSDATQRKLMQEQADQRKKEAEDKLIKEAEEAKLQAEKTIEANKQMETAGTLFESAAALAEVADSGTGKVRQGYKINVLNASGWGGIFLFYFEKEGMNLSVDEMGKKTMNQMKAFCEKHAHKTGEKISSAHLTYEEDFKAVTTK
jgi:hypothetical protein